LLVVCRKDLTEEDLQRLQEKLAPLPYDLRWRRRGGRLVLLLDRARADQPDLMPVLDDPAVEHVLRDPSEREIARIFSRRDLLDLALLTTGVLAAGALVGPVSLFLTAPAGERSRRGALLVGKADSIPVHGARSKVIDGEEYLIIRRDEDRFQALSATCTHSQICLVAWDAERQQLICPCHRGIFDLNGNVVSGPPPRPLRQLEAFTRGGDVYVRRGER
jgi:cytochrome b6-f complex iron-sulfur subunit